MTAMKSPSPGDAFEMDPLALQKLRRIAATSIFRIFIIASNTRFAAAGSGSFIPTVSATGVICHDKRENLEVVWREG